MIPTLDMAKLVASRGIKATIITTPLNESVFSKAIQRNKHSGFEIDIHLIKFRAVENGLPEESMMQEPLEQLIQECRPNCLVSDLFFLWTIDTAAKFNIPRLAIHGTSFFALCVSESIRLHKPFKNVSSDSDTFVVPNLPHQIKESGLKGYGIIFNSFYELEQDYVEHYTKVLGRKSWAIGPSFVVEDKTESRKKSSIDKHDCMKWLDSKKSSSIVYICFRSIANFTASQMCELAMGIEDSGQDFIWVVRTDNEDWLTEGFEERIKEKGLIIRGWAPQVLILDHKAIGAFVTHCGWNSTLEGISAVLPMVTWPVFAEQFFNEKLVTEVLRTGVGVGSVKWQKTCSV
ncbi:hypothetical protein RND71_041676 [Anisodus tanguticus]|uniref:UDP-glycosyltransferases domain-containing protein n=1 Tax=Anisodus tanguticus TaxID=243964 RepID=A0AAE1QUK2_9SOLA|nr:hypothetical protein RND71_041676 [Anisodus tanguticus]